MIAPKRKPYVRVVTRFCTKCGFVSFGPTRSGAELSPTAERLTGQGAWATALHFHWQECCEKRGPVGATDNRRGHTWQWELAADELVALGHLADYAAVTAAVHAEYLPASQAAELLRAVQ